MRRSSPPAAGLAGAALATCALLAAAPVSAAPGDSRAAQLTSALKQDPVYVSPSLSRVVTPAQVAQLRRQVAAMPYPTFVAIIPRFPGEPGPRSGTELATILRDRLGRDGLYVVQDRRYGLDARAFGVQPKGDVRRAGLIASDAVPTNDGPVANVRFALDHLATGRQADRSVSAEREADDALPSYLMAGGAAAGLVVPLGVFALLPSSRRRRAESRALRRAQKAAAPRNPTVSEPSAAEALREAQDELAALARAIEGASAPSDEALRAYEAASHALAWDGARPIDHVGAAVLAQRGRRALRGPVPAPCFFDPRHGDGVRASRWRRQRQDVAIPVCTTCASTLARGATPVSLGDRGRPYWDQKTVWARTGFGAIDEDVADAVLAGLTR